MIHLSASISNKLSHVYICTDFPLTCGKWFGCYRFKAFYNYVLVRCTKATQELYGALLLIHQDSGWHQVQCALHVTKYLRLHVVHFRITSGQFSFVRNQNDLKQSGEKNGFAFNQNVDRQYYNSYPT